MPAKRKPNSFALFIPLEARTVETYSKQRARLEFLMGETLARYFTYVDPAPSIPNAERLNPAREAKDLHSFMLRNQLTLGEMKSWILATEEEEMVIEQWTGSDSSLLGLASTMLDFRREVWGEFLLLLEKEEHWNASRNSCVNERRGERSCAVRL